MPYKAGYWVDLSTVKLDDTADTLTWIQAMPLGEYEHPVHGTISITPERIKRFAANVVSKVRGQDLDIDYDHKERSGEAAGWVKNAEAREDGLWVLVEWTKDAFDKIRNKAYRYFSPEFVDEWEHPKTGQKFQDVLFGGGITNRPFLKDILPINMSELDAVAHTDTPKQPEGGSSMDPKKLRQLLGLPEDATDEQVEAKLQSQNTGAQGGDNTNQQTGGDTGSTTSQQQGGTTTAAPPDQQNPPQLSEGMDVVKLAETSKDPVVRALAESLKVTQQQLAVNSAALRLTEVQGKVTKLSEAAKTNGWGFAPVVKEAITTALTESHGKVHDAVLQALTKVAESKPVLLGEYGKNGNHQTSDDPVKSFTEAVAKVQTDNKLGYADAVQKVAADQPQLFDEYRQASFAGRE